MILKAQMQTVTEDKTAHAGTPLTSTGY